MKMEKLLFFIIPILLVLLIFNGREFFSASYRSALEAQTEIVIRLVSSDNKYTAYIRGGGRLLYIGEGQEAAKAVKINTGLENYTSLSWSPNSRYLFAGSAESGEGVIIDPEKLLSVGQINDYLSGPVWNPEGDKACFAVKSSIQTDNGHDEETTDVVVKKFNERFDSQVRLARGDTKYYYKVDNWGADGKIQYRKLSREGDLLQEVLSAEFVHHLWEFDLETKKRKDLAAIQDIEYGYFSLSPDQRWLSMVKITSSSGDGEEGIPVLYRIADGKRINLEEAVQGWGWDSDWFADSSRIMDRQAVYDLKAREAVPYQLPDDMIPLSCEPSPDGKKIAVFAYRQLKNNWDKSQPLVVCFLDSQTLKILKTVHTPLMPLEDKLGSPQPIRADWMKDSQSLIAESWVMEEYPESSLWKIDFANGAVSEQFDNGQYPLVSPDGKNILYLTQEYLKDESNPNPKTILKVVSRDGMIKETLDLRENGFYAFAEEMVWNNSDNSIVLTAFSLEDGILKKYILIWNYKKGLLDQLNVDFSTTLLDCREGKIICMDGSVD